MIYTIVKTDSDNAAFQSLIPLLDQYLLGLFGPQQAFFDKFNKTNAIKHVIVLYANDEPIGCGAIKHYSADTMEVKRMFIKPAFRGKNLGLMVLQALEAWVADLGYDNCILETGKIMGDAVKLYQNNGYQIIDNCGQYIGVEASVCMMKKVTG